MAADLTVEQMATIGRDVIAHFPDDDRRRWRVDNRTANNPAHVPLVYAFTRHSLRLGRAFLDLSDAGLRLESLPVLRSCYEHALTAAWLAESREGVTALFNEDLRQRKALAKVMARSATEMFREGASNIAGLDIENLETSADAQARNFEQLCNQLEPGGADAYVYYKAMSAHCHPTAAIADSYVHAAPEQPSGELLLLVPKESEHLSWTNTGVASMIWAARALDNMKIGHPDRAFLNEKADELGVGRGLALTAEARRTQWRAERDRKQAQRLERRQAKESGAVGPDQVQA